MYSEKYLLFTTGGGSSDPLNWDSSEAAIYSIKDFKGMKPTSARTIDMFFKTDIGREVVTLSIKNGTHISVMTAIGNALNSANQSVISIADVGSGNFIHRAIYDVVIKANEKYIQTLTGNSRTAVSVTRDNYSSLIIANTHSGAVTCSLELHDGSTYTYLIKTVSIPTAASLVLEANEIAFDRTTYTLHATSNNASGLLTLTFNY